MGLDIKNYYLGTPLDQYEYMRFRWEHIPDEIKQEYQFENLLVNGWIYVEIRKGMYGLPQAGILANKLLKKRLAKHGYYECDRTPGLWGHEWRPVTFVLVVDDFGVKYSGKEHAQHLYAALKENYEVTTDWEGERFVGIKLNWDYNKRTVTMSMPGYIEAALKRFQHKKPNKPEHCPHLAQDRQIRVKVQLTAPEDNSPQLSKEQKKEIQRIIDQRKEYYLQADLVIDCKNLSIRKVSQQVIAAVCDID